MLARCFSQRDKGFKSYGGRGITVCREWRESFEFFIRDMGARPSPKHSIERLNVNGNYEPSNCVWATQEQQAANRRNTVVIEHDGRRMTASEWARELGISRQALDYRMKSGWSVEMALAKRGQIMAPAPQAA